MSVVRSLIVLAFLGSSLASLRADEMPPAPAEDPLLQALIEEALTRNPDLLAARQELAAARSRPAQARALPDPMLSVSYTNDGWGPSLGEQIMTRLGVMWSQDLPFPGKRRLRGQMAEVEADAVAQQVERARLSLTAGVKRAYYGLALARDLLDLIREQERTWQEIERVAIARYTVGQGAQQDVLRAQVEVTRIEQLLAEQRAEVEIRLAEINRLLDRAPDAPLEGTAHLALRPSGESLEALLERLLAISPELEAAALAVERERLAVALAKKDFKPDFSVQAGYMNRGGLDPMWEAGVGISLPIYRKKRHSALAEAEARTRASERRVESVRLQLRFRTQERLAQLRSEEKIAALYERGIIPQDGMSVEAAVANYQVGKLPFITVLEALATLYADRTTYLRLLASQEMIRASLEEASLEATSEQLSMGRAGARAMGGLTAGAGMSAMAGR